MSSGSGAVLRSLASVAYYVGAAAAERSGIETIRFERDCTAQSSLLGLGSWGWANGGFGAHFLGESVMFPRQEPPPSAGDNSKRCALP